MTLRGSCGCNNITFSWHNVDLSLVPRQCGCDYCAAKGAAYISKSGTRVKATIRNQALHAVKHHGSGQAAFHECSHCGDVVFATAEIDGDLYGALNAQCLDKRERFPEAIQVNFSDQSPQDKLDRWRQNWCYPVLIE